MKKIFTFVFVILIGALGVISVLKYIGNAFDYKGDRRKNRKSKTRRVNPSNYNRK